MNQTSLAGIALSTTERTQTFKMICLISGGPKNMEGLAIERFGVLQTPADVNPKSSWGRIWAGDNGCYSKFDQDSFAWMLQQLLPQRFSCKFIACPDVVGSHEETKELFFYWLPKIRAHGYPVAFVAQDGATLDNVPWGLFDALFIGGTTEFKLSPTVLSILAKAQGLWRHIGRVNSFKRFKHFYGKAESFDGSGFSRFPKRRLLVDDWHRMV